MSASQAEPVLSSGERLFGALVTLVLLGALVLTGLVLNRYEQRIAFDEDARSVMRDVAAGIDELDTAMTTLVGMHHAETALSGAEGLIALFEQLRARAPHVLGVGRYAMLAADERADFEQDREDSGLYALRLTAIDTSGHAYPREPSERYYPISMLEPMDPARLRLIGADLGSVPGLGEALHRVASGNTTLVTTLPPSWPSGGGFAVFRAAYRGKHPPESAAERLRQFDQGYWFTVSPATMLEAANGPLERFDLALHVEDERGRRTLLEREASALPDIRLDALLPHREIERRWPFGDGAIVLTLGAEAGMSSRLFGMLGALALLVVLSVGASAAFVRGRRLRALDRQRSVAALSAEREKADRTLNAIDDAVFTLDADHRVLHLNPAAAQLLGSGSPNVLDLVLSEVLLFRHERSGRRFDLEAALDALERGGVRDIDLVLDEGNGDGGGRGTDEAVLRLTLTRTVDLDGTTSGHILVLRDVSAERRLTRRLEYQAHHDALTGCTNRRHFEARLAALLDEMPASGRRHALCYIDLDQFKIVNDTCGHAAGDRLLQDLTVRLLSLCRANDTLSRLGGDEFGLIIVDVDEEAAREVAERVLGFFRGYLFRHGDKTFSIRASIGFVPLDERSGRPGDVMAAADLACYAAKDGGRNGLYVYAADDETMAQRTRELNRLPELQRALSEDRFELHVQAVARIGPSRPGGEVTHFEFLLRLSDEEGRPITPFRIIEAAERYGLMREIDRWVIARALRMVASIVDGPGSDCSFSINLSGQSAADPTLIEFIEREYERHDIDPARIWFELTETAAISHFSIAVELAGRIRALGSKVALDDFGSGLSSFGYLKNIPVDVVKIDGQFVREIAGDPVDRTVVRAIDEVGKAMGIVTVAEFVEDQAILDELIRIGIDYAQGYHLGRPCPLPEALAALTPSYRRAA